MHAKDVLLWYSGELCPCLVTVKSEEFKGSGPSPHRLVSTLARTCCCPPRQCFLPAATNWGVFKHAQYGPTLLAVKFANTNSKIKDPTSLPDDDTTVGLAISQFVDDAGMD